MNEKQKSNRLISYLKKEHLLGKALAGLLILAAIVAVIIGIKKVVFSENQTTKIGFENIGELATQSSYCTQVNVTDSSKKLFGAVFHLQIVNTYTVMGLLLKPDMTLTR